MHEQWEKPHSLNNDDFTNSERNAKILTPNRSYFATAAHFSLTEYNSNGNEQSGVLLPESVCTALYLVESSVPEQFPQLSNKSIHPYLSNNFRLSKAPVESVND
jgi:hypothetical protein